MATKAHREKKRLKGGKTTPRRPAPRRPASRRLVRKVAGAATAPVPKPGAVDVPRDEEVYATPTPERERSSYDGDTAIKLYLREIGQVKLLTPQEEIELAARIKKGDKKARELMIKAN